MAVVQVPDRKYKRLVGQTKAKWVLCQIEMCNYTEHSLLCFHNLCLFYMVCLFINIQHWLSWVQYSIQDAICLEPRVRVIKTSLLLNRIQRKTNTICEPLSSILLSLSQLHFILNSIHKKCTVWWAKPDNTHANSYAQKLWRRDACKHMGTCTMHV